MRVLVGAPTSNIKAWQISKVQDNQNPARGVKMITLFEHEKNMQRDLVDVENREFYADYYSILGTKPDDVVIDTKSILKVYSDNDVLKMGSTFKLFVATVFDSNGNDVTSSFNTFTWTAFINGINITNSNDLTWLIQTSSNEIKVKLAYNKVYLSEKILIKCDAGSGINGELELNITRL